MAKYTIETDGNIADDISGYLGIRIEICNKRTWVKTDIELTPYTEPDLEQVRKEAYEKGWKEAEDHYEKGYNDGYDAGLSDAWEAARKVTQVRKYGGYGITATLKRKMKNGMARIKKLVKK